LPQLGPLAFSAEGPADDPWLAIDGTGDYTHTFPDFSSVGRRIPMHDARGRASMGSDVAPPLVSVVIPAYNAERFVTTAVESVLAQTHGNVEIIVVDDLSKDGTADVLAPYVRAGKVTLVTHESNGGVAAARNSGVRTARGEYIAFLDADDRWLPHHLETGLHALERHPEIDAVCLNFEMLELDTNESLGTSFDRHRDALSRLRSSKLDDGFVLIEDGLLTTLLQHFFIHMQSLIARAPLVRRLPFNEALRRSEDLEWCLRAAHAEKIRIAYSNVVTTLYFRHANSLTTRAARNHESIARTELDLYRKFREWPDLNASQRAIIDEHLLACSLDLSYYARRRGELRVALGYLRRSTRYGWTARQALEAVKIVASGLKPRAQRA
jgi:glycosyltransferase involved in cell wall biosynthesis